MSRTMTRVVRLTIRSKGGMTTTITADEIITSDETEAKAIESAKLKWLNNYIRRDFPDRKFVYVMKAAKSIAGIDTIKGKIL